MPSTLKAIIVIAALAALPLQAGHAAAGRFLSVVGDVRVVTVDGDRRTVNRGAEVDSGETVVTGDNSFAQLTMTDGARLQIREDTELKLDDYAYEEQGAGRSFMSLLRGTMRSLTGLIGQRRKEDYRVRTPHATIGIRGTDHQVTVLLKPREGFEPGTFDVVITGRTVMQTNAGRIEIAPRQAGYVTSQTVSPRVIEVPAFLKPGPTPTPVRAAPAASRGQARSGKAEGGQDEDGRPVLKRRAAVKRLGSRTEGETTTLRTPLSSPLLTPLSGTSTKTLSPDSTTSTTLERSTTTLESYKTLDSTTTTKTLEPSTTTTLESYKTLDSTTTTLSPTTSTKTLSPTTSTKTLSPTTSTTTTTTTKTLSPTTTLTSPTKTISPTTTR